MLDPDIISQIHALEDPGEPSLLAELIEAFRLSAADHVRRLTQALVADDAEAFASAAHALKGSAASLGAMRVYAAASTLELRGRERRLANVATELSALETDVAEAFEALCHEEHRYRQELGSVPDATATPQTRQDPLAGPAEHERI